MIHRQITEVLDALPWLIDDGLLPFIIVVCSIVLMTIGGALGRTRHITLSSILGGVGAVLFLGGSVFLAIAVGSI